MWVQKWSKTFFFPPMLFLYHLGWKNQWCWAVLSFFWAHTSSYKFPKSFEKGHFEAGKVLKGVQKHIFPKLIVYHLFSSLCRLVQMQMPPPRTS